MRMTVLSLCNYTQLLASNHLLLSSFQTKLWQATYVKCMLSSLPLLQDGPHNL